MPLSHATMRLLVTINALLILHVGVCLGVEKDMRSIWVVVPPEVERGSDVTLQCLYDLGDRPLYRVEWYRGNYVFYRYAPQDKPATKIFPRPDINVSVDLSRSNDTQLIIKDVNLNFSGDLTCEVTTEPPFITTITASANINVNAFPARDPIVNVEKGSYLPRETLRVNCTSYPSHPPATLSFFVNNLPVPSSRRTESLEDDQLMWSLAELKLKLDETHFKHGQLVVGCTAIVGNLYRRSTEVNLAYRSRDPIPERVTFHNSQGPRTTPSYFQWMLILIVSLVIAR